MTVEKKYASIVDQNVEWNDEDNALGVEDVSCASSSSMNPLNRLDLKWAFNLPDNAVITQVLIDCKVAVSGGYYLSILLGDGESKRSFSLGDIDGEGKPICANTAYLGAKDVTVYLDTPTKVNNCEISFQHVSGSGGEPWTAFVDATWIQVTYTIPTVKPHSGTLLSPGIFCLPNQVLKNLYRQIKLGILKI